MNLGPQQEWVLGMGDFKIGLDEAVAELLGKANRSPAMVLALGPSRREGELVEAPDIHGTWSVLVARCIAVYALVNALQESKVGGRPIELIAAGAGLGDAHTAPESLLPLGSQRTRSPGSVRVGV